jgi:uncharacterized protein (DUF4415 family)
MPKNSKREEEPWIDPDDSPEWTEEMFRAAAIYRGDKLIRPATGVLGPNGVVGRPPSENPKKQITLRLDPDVIEGFRATGKGWQSRVNKALREALGLASR